MLCDAAEGLRGVRGVGESFLMADGEMPSQAAVTVFPLTTQLLVREVVLIVGDGKPVMDVGTALAMLAKSMRLHALSEGMSVLSFGEVWNAARIFNPPLFSEVHGVCTVEPTLLQSVRAMTLTVCSCGAHFELDTRCYICAHHASLEAYNNKRYQALAAEHVLPSS